jgi:hypothetical protein
MKKIILLIPILSFGVFSAVYSAEKTICDAKLMSCYEENIKNCTGPTSPWWVWPDLGSITEKYVEFKNDKIDALIQKIPLAQTGPEAQSAMQEKLNALSDRQYLGFRAAETARLLYRRNMNEIFSCTVIASRQTKLEKLQNIIGNKSGASSILESIKKERKRYELLMSKKNCLQNGSTQASDKVVDRLAISAAGEYCKYTYYLDYLQANVTTDFSQAIEIDKKIGWNTWATSVRTTDEANARMTTWINTLESERSRANSTVPKAIMAFQEMDRTYITHLLLVIIYDDYIKLRDNLDKYMSIVSQTFEKAYNAQDANKR